MKKNGSWYERVIIILGLSIGAFAFKNIVGEKIIDFLSKDSNKIELEDTSNNGIGWRENLRHDVTVNEQKAIEICQIGDTKYSIDSNREV